MLVSSPYMQGVRVVGVGDRNHIFQSYCHPKKSAPTRPSKRTLDPSKCPDLLLPPHSSSPQPYPNPCLDSGLIWHWARSYPHNPLPHAGGSFKSSQMTFAVDDPS